MSTERPYWHCGKPPQLHEANGFYTVVCVVCGAEGPPWMYPDIAVVKWNIAREADVEAAHQNDP